MINTKFLSILKPIAPIAMVQFMISIKDDSLDGRYNKLCQKFFDLISRETQNADSYIECYHQARSLFDDLNSELSSRESRYQELFEAPKSLNGDAKREALREMLSYRAEKLRLDKESQALKKGIYDIVAKIHEMFNIPPVEISLLMEEVASEWMGKNDLVQYYNNLFTKKRAHGSNDFSDLIKAKSVIDEFGSEIDSREKCNLYMNLAYTYEVFDYSKSLEYIQIAETFGDFYSDEIIESKASYNLSIMNKGEFKKFFNQIKNVQKRLELLSDFRRSFSNDDSLKIKSTSIKGSKASEEQSMQRDLKRIAMSKAGEGGQEKIKNIFYKLMLTDSALSGQKHLASTLISLKSNSKALEFLNEVNEKYPHLRDNSIFNPNLMITEISIFQRNNLFKEAVEKLHILEEKLAPYGENIKSILQYLNSVKLSLFYNLVSNLDLNLAESIFTYLPEDEREAINILFNKIKDHLLPENSSQFDKTKEKPSLEDLEQEKEELEKAFKIKLPTNSVEFAEQVSLGSIPLEALSGKLAHAYFMCKRSISMLESLSPSESTSEINWNIDAEHGYSYPTQNGPEVIKLNSLPKHYIAIDPELELDTDQKAACIKVLEMGRAARKKDQAGVKMLDGKLYELKILGEFGDLRLIADTCYDYQGNKLIIFNRKANHSQVKEYLKSGKRINVENLNQDQPSSSSEANMPKDLIDFGQNYYSKVLAEEGDMVIIGDSSIDF